MDKNLTPERPVAAAEMVTEYGPFITPVAPETATPWLANYPVLERRVETTVEDMRTGLHSPVTIIHN